MVGLNKLCGNDAGCAVCVCLESGHWQARRRRFKEKCSEDRRRKEA